MKKMLRGILNWLERKFPDRVVVTQKDYDATMVRVQKLEAQVQALNVSLGLVGMQANIVGQGPFRR